MLFFLLKKAAKGLSFAAIATLFASCSILVNGKILIKNGEYARWVSLYQTNKPLKPQRQLALNTEYILFLNNIDYHRKNAEHQLNPTIAEKIAAFPTLISQVESIDSNLSNFRKTYHWVPAFLELAPYYAPYLSAKQYLKSQNYTKALEAIAQCPATLLPISALREEIIQTLLLDHIEQFKALEQKQAYAELAQKLARFQQLLQKLQLHVGVRSCLNGQYSNFADYVSGLQQRVLEEFEKSAQNLTSAHFYCEAIAELSKAFVLLDNSALATQKKQINELIMQYRSTGISWYTALQKQAENAADFSQALTHLQKVCCLNPQLNCSAEENRIRLLEFTKELKVLQQGGNLEAMVALLEKLPAFAVNDAFVVSLRAQCFKEYGHKLLGQGDTYLTAKNYSEARSRYTSAKKYVDASAKIADCDDAEGRSFYPLAASYAAASPRDCKKAAELIKKAVGLVKHKATAEKLLAQYLTCATKRLAVILQADDANFAQSNERYAIIDAALANLPKDEYLKIVPSNELPVVPRKESPIALATKLGVDYALVISLDNPEYKKLPDLTGKTSRYCTSTSYPNYAYQIFNYTTINVMVHKDEANIRLQVRASLIKVETNEQLKSGFYELQKSWSKEYWSSSKEPQYIRFCPCGSMVNTTENTRFLDNPEQFNKPRLFPSGMDLIRSDLIQEVKKLTSNFSID